MHPRKSPRHQHAARCRWRRQDQRAEAEREAGIIDVPLPTDCREPFLMPLSAFGYHDVMIEPRIGYQAWRAVRVDTGQVLHCAKPKELLRWIALQLPQTRWHGVH